MPRSILNLQSRNELREMLLAGIGVSDVAKHFGIRIKNVYCYRDRLVKQGKLQALQKSHKHAKEVIASSDKTSPYAILEEIIHVYEESKSLHNEMVTLRKEKENLLAQINRDRNVIASLKNEVVVLSDKIRQGDELTKRLRIAKMNTPSD